MAFAGHRLSRFPIVALPEPMNRRESIIGEFGGMVLHAVLHADWQAKNARFEPHKLPHSPNSDWHAASVAFGLQVSTINQHS